MGKKVAREGLLDYYRRFSTEQSCLQYIFDTRFKDGLFCPICGGKRKIWTLKESEFTYKCGDCLKRFTPTSRTGFQSSIVPLTTWFNLIAEFAFSKRNISSYNLASKFGLSQRSAWLMQNKLRESLKQDESLILSGVVEIDEVYIAATKRYSKGKGGISNRKSPILGLVERSGRVIVIAIPNRSGKTLKKVITDKVALGSTIYTDDYEAYKYILTDYTHETINHSIKQFSIDGEVYTNNCERMWGAFKQNIRGSHHRISGDYIQSYCDELAYRENTRCLTDSDRFIDVLKRMLK